MDVGVNGLSVRFPGDRPAALEEVSLRIGDAEQVALLGPSGSGKTTLLRTLVGAVHPTAGEVRIGGRDPFGRRDELRELRRATGVVRQGNDLVLPLSARMNALVGTVGDWSALDWVTAVRGHVPAGCADRLWRLSDELGINGMLQEPAVRLSGGQRQRVALIRALLPGPRLLLADEPTTGLDPATAASAVRALRSAGSTLLLATHDLRVAREFPRVIALRGGRLVHDGAGFDEAAATAVYGVGA